MEQKVLRVCTWVIVGALGIRLLAGVNFGHALQFTLSPEIAGWMVFLQTGRVVRPGLSREPETLPETQPETQPETNPDTRPPEIIKPILPDLPVFSPELADSISINSSFSFTADLPALISQALTWDLTQEGPTVLILHTHGSESFSPAEDYVQSSPYHTLDTDHNMISVGAYLAKKLEAAGISVLHDTVMHDAPSYNAAYTNSRNSIQKYLEAYPTIRLVLDLHRDAYEDASGNQGAQTVFSNGSALAPLMFVVGTNQGGLEHPGWQENLSLALKLQTQLEALCPGICRKINLRTQRYNQDLSAGALLVEIGSSGNTRQEALGAADMLSRAIICLAKGSR